MLSERAITETVRVGEKQYQVIWRPEGEHRWCLELSESRQVSEKVFERMRVTVAQGHIDEFLAALKKVLIASGVRRIEPRAGSTPKSSGVHPGPRFRYICCLRYGHSGYRTNY